MHQDRIQELAVIEATTGLGGAELYEFEQWWAAASEEERTHFRESVDLIAMISQSEIPQQKPPAHVKDKVMRSIETRTPAETRTPLPGGIPGYCFLSDAEGIWRQLPNKGARIKELSCSRASGTAVFILELDAGAKLLSHDHRGCEEAFVLHGDLQMCGRTLLAGDYMRAEAGTRHQDLYSEGGCRALIITAQENYPRRSIRAFDGLHRVWSKCKGALSGSKN